MSRPLRIEYENAVYHVMNRGRGRMSIFHDKDYYKLFLKCLAEASQRFGLEVLAYCLMGNHYHLLLKTPRANISRCMRHIDGLYTQRYNRLRRTDGALFRGRYKAIVVEADDYLLPVSRYIHRNPIATKHPMVKDIEDYEWSSYLCYINKASTPVWLIKSEVLSLLSAQNKSKSYKSYVGISCEQELIDFYSQKRQASVLGSEDFKEEVKKFKVTSSIETPRWAHKTVISIDKIIASVASHYNMEQEQLLKVKRGSRGENIPRKVAIYLSVLLSGETLTKIAKAFHINHYSTVSQTVYRLRKEMMVDKSLTHLVNVKCQDLTP